MRNPLGVGIIAVVFLLAAEVAVAAGLRRLSLGDYIRTRDPVSGAVYLLLLALFAVMPLLLSRAGAKK